MPFRPTRPTLRAILKRLRILEMPFLREASYSCPWRAVRYLWPTGAVAIRYSRSSGWFARTSIPPHLHAARRDTGAPSRRIHRDVYTSMRENSVWPKADCNLMGSSVPDGAYYFDNHIVGALKTRAPASKVSFGKESGDRNTHPMDWDTPRAAFCQLCTIVSHLEDSMGPTLSHAWPPNTAATCFNEPDIVSRLAAEYGAEFCVRRRVRGSQKAPGQQRCGTCR